jgi:phosphoglycerol transferase MdoB-like AlkP superfamily enzyme
MVKKSTSLFGLILIGVVCSIVLVIWSHNYLWHNKLGVYQNWRVTDFFKWNFLIVSIIVSISIMGLRLLGYRNWWVLITIISVIGFFAFALAEKIKYTGAPFHPSDLFFLKKPLVFLEFTKLPTIIKWGACIAVIFFLLLGTTHAIQSWLKSNRKENSIRFLLLGLLVIFCTICVSKGYAFFVKKTQATYMPWNYESSVEKYGIYPAFLVAYMNSQYEEPPISKKNKNIIIKELTSLELVKKPKELPDIVIMQSEAYSDFTGTKLKWNINPNSPLYSIDSGIHGKFVSNTFGGRTANAEFEVLTSMKLKRKNENRIPYQEGLMGNRETPNLVRDVRNLGMETVAIHPFRPVYFQRREVYPMFGFNQFLSEKDFPTCKKYGRYLPDNCGTEKAISLIDREGSQFIFFVTMQNHFDWYKGLFPKEPIVVSGVSMEPAIKGKVESYASGINKSGENIVSLWNQLKKRKAPTIVLFYGDHRPTFGEKKETYEKWGAPIEKSTTDWYNETPLWIWSNDKETLERIKTFTKPFFENGELKLEAYEIAPLLMKIISNDKIDHTWYDWVLQNHSEEVLSWVIYDRVYGDGITIK